MIIHQLNISYYKKLNISYYKKLKKLLQKSSRM